MCVEIAMIEPTTQVAGAYVLLDMKGLTLQHVWQFTPMFAKTALEFIQVKKNQNCTYNSNFI